MVQTTVLPVSTVFLTVRITIAAALASNPDVGSSMKIMDGLATNSTAIVNLCVVRLKDRSHQANQLVSSSADSARLVP
jgi:hypothetical protein